MAKKERKELSQTELKELFKQRTSIFTEITVEMIKQDKEMGYLVSTNVIDELASPEELAVLRKELIEHAATLHQTIAAIDYKLKNGLES